MISAELQRAFVETHYIVRHKQPFTLHINQPSPELDALLQETEHDCAAFITAWNPMAKPLNTVENHARQRQLTDDLTRQGYLCIPGLGIHPSNGWPGEESVLILGMQLDVAQTVANTWLQLAFVWGRRSESARLIHNSSNIAQW